MDFFTNLGGLVLFVVCVGIVVVFLKDFFRLNGENDDDKLKRGKHIAYEIFYKKKVLQEGQISMNELPVQFGRVQGSGNDVVIAPEGMPREVWLAVHRTWFYIERKDISGEFMIYSADKSSGEPKVISAEKKLIVEGDGQEKPKLAIKMDPEVTLKAERLPDSLRVVLSVQE